MRVARYSKWGLLTLLVLVVVDRAAYVGLDRLGVIEAIRTARMEVLVDDQAGLLSPEQRDQIVKFHTAILTAYDIDFRIATVRGSQDINMTAADRFAGLEIGNLSLTGRGLLLLVAPDADNVRIEVGRSLEPVFTDTFVAYIEERQMVPFFQAGRVADGILATTELIADRAGDGMQTAAFADPASGAVEPSAGGGAGTAAQIGAGYERPLNSIGDSSAAGLGPIEVVAAYLGAMAAGNTNPNLEIFTDATRDMMRGWVVTLAQMRQIARTYQQCRSPRLFQTNGLAVVRYGIDERACAPFFLRRSSNDWRLDLTMMSGAIRFNHRIEWHFVKSTPSEFSFAFEDWRFDTNGFPRP